MTSLALHQKRQTLSYVAFAIVALVSLVVWGVELWLSIESHNDREEEALVSYQQRQVELKSEAIRDLLQELYQTGRTLSLLPALREAPGRNRRSAQEDVVREGRLSPDTHRMLQQVYANLRAYVHVSEVYFVLNGFEPGAGEVPFFMYDGEITHQTRAGVQSDADKDVPAEDETAEYAEIGRQLAWFRENAPTFSFGTELNTIPSLISPMIRTCDTTQYVSLAKGDPRDAAGFVFSLPVYDLQTARFKGVISLIIRANVFEARLIGVPFIPVTAADHARMAADGWQMPPPSSFVLTEDTRTIEVSDRRHPLLGKGVAAALNQRPQVGRWASLRVELPVSGVWQMHHHMTVPEIEQLVGGIRNSKRLSVAGRVLLLTALGSFLGWGFWLMRASRRELIKMAHYDLLTDLPNRRLFFDRLENGMARSKRNETKLGLFFVDLAGLNAINDRYGHHGGDLILVKLANRLHDHLRETDGIFSSKIDEGKGSAADSRSPLNFILSRLGGDEFTILCEDLHSADDLIIVAERIADCVREPFLLGEQKVDITLNVGAALFPDDAEDAERLLMSADSAMHECKHTQSHFVLFNEGMRQRAERLHLLTLELNSALPNQQFELYYQPKARLDDGHVVSMEALIRWHHPRLGLVSPLEFIPILERNGAIVEVGEWVVEQACRDLHRLTEAGFPDVKVSVNVSVRQLRRGNFHDFLKRTMEVSGIEPSRLILEITETVVIEDLQTGRAVLLALVNLGVSLAIDDFGAGYSSLTYLQLLPLHSLKIDKSLIDGMVDDRAIHVVESVIRLAQGLSLKTIAEGIETEEQRSLIHRLGCDMIQGYLLSRPLPLPEIIAWLNERRRTGVSNR